MCDTTDWTRITRFVSGECTAEEAAATKAWLAADAERLELAERLQHIWEATETLDGDADADFFCAEEAERSWERLEARMDELHIRRNGHDSSHET